MERRKKLGEDVEMPSLTLPVKTDDRRLPKKGEEAMKTYSDSAEVFQLMEGRDEEQIIQEILGVYSQEYVYDIPFKDETYGKLECDSPKCSRKGKFKHVHVRGLSYSGIKEARRLYKGIVAEASEPELVKIKGKEFWKCKVTVTDLRTGNSTTSWKMSPLYKKKIDGSFREDEFAFESAQSKAKRNAIGELLPQPLIKAWIKDYLEGKQDFDPKHVKNLKQGVDYKVGSSVPEPTPGEGLSLKDEVKGLLGQLEPGERTLMLESLTTYTNKTTGKKVAGKKDIEDVSPKQLFVVRDRLKKALEARARIVERKKTSQPEETEEAHSESAEGEEE